MNVTTNEDTPVPITVSPEDANGDALEISFEAPSQGTLSGTGTTVTYTPAADFNGEVKFKVSVSDGQTTTMATVKVTILPVNDPPVAVDDTAATDEDVALTLAPARC